MKKQKIALGKLALNKERISDLNADEQGNVLGGSPSINICPVTIQVACQSVICPTRIIAQCLNTRIGPHCIPVPVTITKTITDPGPISG